MANSMQRALDRALVTGPGDTSLPASPAVRGRGRSTAASPPEEPVASRGPAGKAERRPARADKRLIGGHFDPAVARQLRVIAAEGDTTVQALLEEAIDLLFAKKARDSLR